MLATLCKFGFLAAYHVYSHLALQKAQVARQNVLVSNQSRKAGYIIRA